MSHALVVWDQAAAPPQGLGTNVLCWRSNFQDARVFSVPRHLETHAGRLKARYLSFIHDLGNVEMAGKRIVDHLDIGGGANLWWMSLLAEKSPFKSPEIYACLRLLALEEMLVEKNAGDLTLVSSDGMLAQAVGALCRRRGMRFSWLKGQEGQSSSLRTLYRKLPHPLQGLIYFVRHLLKRWALAKSKPEAWYSGEGSIFFCSYFTHLAPDSCRQGRFYSRQWETLPKMLHEEGWHTNWIQHFMFSSIVPDTKTGLDWLGRFNQDKGRQGCHSFLDRCLSWQVAFRVLSKWFKLNVASWKLGGLESALDGSASYLWPLLKNDWLSSLTGQAAVSNLLWSELFDEMLRDMPRQKLGFYLYEEMGWESAFLQAWRKNGHGRIVGVSHTTVPFWHMNYFHDPRSLKLDAVHPMPQPDLIAVNGPAMKNSLGNSGYPESRLVEVEALRYLHLEDMKLKKPSADEGALRIIVLGDIILSATRIMLGLVEASLKLIDKECLITFKPHPATYVPASDFPDLHAEETNESLGELLSDFDVAVSAYSSSSALDAYMAGLSVIVYWDGGDFNLSPLRGREDVRFVGTVEEMAGALSARQAEMPSSSEEFFFFGKSLPRWRSIVEGSMGTSPVPLPN